MKEAGDRGKERGKGGVMHNLTSGYGIMITHEKWSSEIRKFFNFLVKNQTCPTDNPFILSERKRLSRAAGAAARARKQ